VFSPGGDTNWRHVHRPTFEIYFGNGTLCGFHTNVGADDMWVSCREAWVRSESAL